MRSYSDIQTDELPQSSSFPGIPYDVLLQLSAFLSPYDDAALAQTNQENRAFFQSMEYWRNRTRRDYGKFSGNEKAREFYLAEHRAMLKDLRDECGVILSLRWMSSLIYVEHLPPEDDEEFNQAQRDYDHLCKVFEMRSRQEFFARLRVIRKKYPSDEHEVTEEDMNALLSVSSPRLSFDDLQRMYPGDNLAAIAIPYIGMLVHGGAKISLKNFLNQLPRHMINHTNIFSGMNVLLRAAIEKRHPEIVRMLLDFGADANAPISDRPELQLDVPLRCLLETLKGFFIKMDTLEMIADIAEREESLLELPEDTHQYFLDHLDLLKECASLLLHRGADPDVLVMDDDFMRGSARDLAQFYFNSMQERDDVAGDIRQRYMDVLSLVIHAPRIEEACEPPTKRFA